MPKTFWTFVICTARAHRHLPAGRLLVEGRDPRRRRPARRRRRLHGRSWSSGIIGAVMTAAYMTRCIYLTLLRRVPRARGRPSTRRTSPARASSCRSSSSPRWRSSPASPTCPTPVVLACPPSRSRCASSTTSSRRATTSRRARRPSPTPSSTSGIAVVSHASIGLIGIGLALPLVLQGPRAPRHHRAQQARPAPATRVLVNKYYLDWLYTDVIVGAVKGPIARAAYWFNQNVHRRRRQRRRRRRRRGRPAASTTTSTRGSSTAPSTARAPPPRAAARRLRQIQTGRCSSTARSSSPAPPSSPASSSSSSRGTRTERDHGQQRLPHRLGPQPSWCSCRWRARW